MILGGVEGQKGGGGGDSTLRPPKASEINPISAPKAPKFWKKTGVLSQKTAFLPKKGKIWPKFDQKSTFEIVGFQHAKFFRKFWKFSKKIGLVKPHTAKIVDQNCNKNENFGVAETPQNPPPPRISLLTILINSIPYVMKIRKIWVRYR